MKKLTVLAVLAMALVSINVFAMPTPPPLPGAPAGPPPAIIPKAPPLPPVPPHPGPPPIPKKPLPIIVPGPIFMDDFMVF
jgi:hypothetical protein